MPAVSKQLSTGANGARQAPGKKQGPVSAWDLAEHINMLLYGISGTGKTTLWATFPGPILALICSGGNRPGELRSINTPEMRKKINPFVIKSTDDYREAMRKASDYATVVVDHASGIQDLTLKEILGLDELPAQKSWGMATQQMYGQSTGACKDLFRLGINAPCHAVFVAHERSFGGGDDDGSSEVIAPKIGASLTPKVTDWMNGACDYVVQAFLRPKMEARRVKVAGKEVVRQERGKGVEYCLRVGPHDVYHSKFRLPRGGPELPECLVDPSYEKILALIEGR